RKKRSDWDSAREKSKSIWRRCFERLASTPAPRPPPKAQLLSGRMPEVYIEAPHILAAPARKGIRQRDILNVAWGDPGICHSHYVMRFRHHLMRVPWQRA